MACGVCKIWDASERQTGKPYLCYGSSVFVVGLVAIILAAVLPGVVKEDVDKALHRDFALAPGSKAWEDWKNSSSENAPFIHYDYHLFNVTDPTGFVQGKYVPIEDVGPITFRENLMMLNSSWSEDNDIIRYQYWEYYTPYNLDYELYNKNITSPRLWFPALVEAGLGALGWAAILTEHKAEDVLFTTRPIKDILWGYKDDLLEDVNELLAKFDLPYRIPSSFMFVPGVDTNQLNEDVARATLPYITMYTGVKTRYRLRDYITWHDQASLQCCSSGPCGGSGPSADWNDPRSAWSKTSPSANGIHGTAGSQFRHYVEKGSTLNAFVDSLFRTVDIVNYGGEVKHVHGIRLFRFSLDRNGLKNAKEYPPNEAFFANGPSGLLNVSNCFSHVPIYISKPHFLDADPVLLSAVNITAPDPRIHDTYVDVEPITGATMQVAERLQGNLKVGKEPYPDPLNKKITEDWYPYLNTTYLPLFWVDKWGAVSEHTANTFKNSIYFANHVEDDARWVGYTLGGIFVAAGIMLVAIGFPRYLRYYAVYVHPARLDKFGERLMDSVVN